MTHSDAAQLDFDGEIYRKLLHLLALGYPIGYLILGNEVGLPIMIGLSVLALGLDWLRSRSKAAHSFFETGFGFMMRRRERDVLESGMVINGATWVTVSFTVLALLFPTDIAVVSFTLFMLGDAAAALIGRKFGRTPWARSGCTIEGSVAFLVVALGAGLAIAWIASPVHYFVLPVHSLVTAAVVAMLLEALPLPVNDNLLSPLGAAISFQLVLSIL